MWSTASWCAWRAPRPTPDGLKALVKKMGNLFKKGKTRHWIADAIRDIKGKVQEIAAQRDRYGTDHVVPNSAAATNVESDPLMSALYTKVADLVGIGQPREEVIVRLTEKNDPIVSIVGFGGLGKTTLAKTVYDSLEAKFECTTFVSVSQNPDITRIFKKMLYQLDQNKYSNINEASRDEEQLIHELRGFLQNKRYLVVIDDIWKVQSWGKIRYALVENVGSRIITTTHNFDIDELVGGSYKLKPLSLETSKMLFYGRIFGFEEECPEQFAEISVKNLKKCGGIPLVLLTMASLLAVTSKKADPKEWDEVCVTIGSGLGDSPNLKNMRAILSHSYHNLPSHLRTCLLYLGVFPEDHEIMKDELIWRWIAEGFMHSIHIFLCILF